MKKIENRFLVAFPDPIIDIEMLSAAALLYFQKPIALTIPPVVILEESYEILSFIKVRNPKWSTKFNQVFDLWIYQQKCFNKVMEILEPLKGKYLKNIWTVYPANNEAMEKTTELIKSTNLTIDSVFNMINPINASGELIRHILLEAYLEQGKEMNALYEYCEELFTKQKLEYLLVKSYLLRMNILKTMSVSTPVLLTNEAIWNSLFNQELNTDTNLDRDIISWELFRQLISPRLDPLDRKKVKVIKEILEERQEEIDRLKLKCYALTEKIKPVIKYEQLSSKVASIIRSEVEKEISDLLKLDKTALEDLFYDVFSDEKTWLAIIYFIDGVINGNVNITTKGAILALSFIGAKSVKSIGERMKKLRQSAFGLVYTISRKIK
ncbi:hypothetical protein TR13x_03900 [Caloranaerobacter sp. TR13]|uniref:hypothetical protein n=1 Tax=Caloranaerobacter sp. TR13 TaxID=1302151 RepID=UPI0006D3F5F8|nr:hypothetical protein [Caloranaerobacter sp. TR13]KPU27677.1 hypothetical protein TR13x_03900 [Caloranaerobacter sp. TR13]